MTLEDGGQGEGVGGDDRVEQGGVGVKEGVQGVEVEEEGGAQTVVQFKGGAGAE
jgi:hypothetical protein